MRLESPIAFIGAGNMTEALVKGMTRAGLADPKRVVASDILPERRAHLEAQYQVGTVKDNREAAAWGNTLILSIEPQVMDEVLDDIAKCLAPDTLVISVAAGYPLARVSRRLKGSSKFIRAMPNTLSSILAGVTAVCHGANVPEQDRDTARAIFESVGKVVTLEERLMDAITGLSGSGPAYAYLIIEALADGGVKMGLPRAVSELLAAQTLLGASHTVLETEEHPGRLKDRVASPGGTTIAGLHKLEEGHVRSVLMNAVEAATRRSQELGVE